MRSFLMLADKYNPDKHNVAGWYMSEKLDGQRCFWDGGVSRGRPTAEVPWANLDKTVKPIASGLWSRYGNVITAPDWFLDGLPIGMFLDGELYCGNLSELRSIVGKHKPDEDTWRAVEFLVFDRPGIEVFEYGRINDPHFKKLIEFDKCLTYLGTGAYSASLQAQRVFEDLSDLLERFEHVKAHPQIKLPDSESKAKDKIYESLDEVTDKGGEGLMLRDPRSYWAPKRLNRLLKVKPFKDAEGIVIGYVAGKDRLKGRLGALRIRWNGVEFDLGTGFDDSERPSCETFYNNPGKLLCSFSIPEYHVGSEVTFRYTSITNDGIPREARFHSVRSD